MTHRLRGLLGDTVHIGDTGRARVTGALVDPTGRVVLVRVEAAGEDVAYIPQAVLYRSSDGAIRTHGRHVLLRQAEVGFYEDHGLEWVMHRDVSGRPARGIVEA
jgi:hypothetical protein